MKKILSCVLMLCLILMSACAFAEEPTDTAETMEILPDFKSFYWGDSKETVVKTEGTPLHEGKMTALDAEYIVYETTAVGLDVLLGHYFCDDGLFQVRYILTETHSNEALYINDYETFRDALTKKYGKPLLDYENWTNDSKKNYYADDKGSALCYGYLTYSTLYCTDRSCIQMGMSADNYDITMTVDYNSTEIDPGEADYSNDI